MPNIVTLLTDFGTVDTYVGQVKAAILAITPTATLVDLTHVVPAHDVRAGAFLLWSAVEVFPLRSVHLAVVDPGVGSSRRAVAARASRGDVFVGPDNGLLNWAIERLGGLESAVHLDRPAFWRDAPPSSTFHGRDIFAPIAGHLAAGTPMEDLGSLITDLAQPLGMPFGRAAIVSPMRGEVVHVDTYGNLITSIHGELLPPRYHVRLSGWPEPIQPAPHYQAVEPGGLLAIIGSAGLLEISAREASAAAITGCARGDALEVHTV